MTDQKGRSFSNRSRGQPAHGLGGFGFVIFLFYYGKKMKPFLTNMFWLGCLKHQLEKRIVQNLIGYPSFAQKKISCANKKSLTKKNPGMDTIGGWQHLEPPEIVFESLGVGPKLCGQNLRILGIFFGDFFFARESWDKGVWGCFFNSWTTWSYILKYVVVSFIWVFPLFVTKKWNSIWNETLPKSVGATTNSNRFQRDVSSDFLEKTTGFSTSFEALNLDLSTNFLRISSWKKGVEVQNSLKIQL